MSDNDSSPSVNVASRAGPGAVVWIGPPRKSDRKDGAIAYDALFIIEEKGQYPQYLRANQRARDVQGPGIVLAVTDDHRHYCVASQYFSIWVSYLWVEKIR